MTTLHVTPDALYAAAVETEQTGPGAYGSTKAAKQSYRSRPPPTTTDVTTHPRPTRDAAPQVHDANVRGWFLREGCSQWLSETDFD